jgi:dephospho-CoA kinase
MRVAITGNIGCGKTTFTKLLLKHLAANYEHASIDDMVRDLYNDKAFKLDLENRFGTSDRKKVSDIVFNNSADRLWLEDLTKDTMRWKLANYDYKKHLVMEFPLLYEMGKSGKYDFVITCHCADDVQMQRVMARDGFTQEKIERIRAAQLSTRVKIAMADDTVDTNISLEDLEDEAKRIADRISLQDLRLFFQGAFYGHEKEAGVLFDNAMKQYFDTSRHWHNADHPRQMYRWFMNNVEKFNYPGIAGLAIIYHDAVYSAYKDLYAFNEAWSVKFMMEQFREHLPEALGFEIEAGIPTLATVAEFIMATKGHAITSPYLLSNPELKADCELFLDVDLMMLGGTEAEANAFDEAVYQEFKDQYDVITFARGRVVAMKTFADRERIFHSPHFSQFEDNAKRNVNNIIKKWGRWI